MNNTDAIGYYHLLLYEWCNTSRLKPTIYIAAPELIHYHIIFIFRQYRNISQYSPEPAAYILGYDVALHMNFS